jgi:hypothetical protein
MPAGSVLAFTNVASQPAAATVWSTAIRSAAQWRLAAAGTSTSRLASDRARPTRLVPWLSSAARAPTEEVLHLDLARARARGFASPRVCDAPDHPVVPRRQAPCGRQERPGRASSWAHERQGDLRRLRLLFRRDGLGPCHVRAHLHLGEWRHSCFNSTDRIGAGHQKVVDRRITVGKHVLLHPRRRIRDNVRQGPDRRLPSLVGASPNGPQLVRHRPTEVRVKDGDGVVPSHSLAT